MKHTPPKWADKFLAWYCRADLLEEIQGDVHELYDRTAKENKCKADIKFIWNVLRFFRWKNIRTRNSNNFSDTQFSIDMLKNILLVAFRNFFRQPAHSLLNIVGLAIGFTCAFFVLVWVSFEYSFDRFHTDTGQIFTVNTHVAADGNIQTYDVASAVLDVSSIPEADKVVTTSTGERWPHILCFRPEDGSECVYLNGVYSNENLFSVFNFSLLSGDAKLLNEPGTIVISEKMAYALFNSTDVLGKTLKVDGLHEVSIIAVYKNIPANSSLQFDFALPFGILKKLWGINDATFAQQFFNTYLKTNSSVSPAFLTEKLNDVRVVTEAYKAQNIRYEALPLTDTRLKSKFENGKQSGGRIEYVILFIIIGTLVTLMAVINFVNMATARATERAKEIGIRKVTGAYRSTIMLQFIGESFLVVLIAFLLAAGVTQLLLPFFNNLLGETLNLNLWQGLIPVFLLGFLLAVALLAGLYPAFVMSSLKTVRVLKGQLNDPMSGSQRLRKSLLVVQLSISIGIIIFCGVLYLQLNYVTQKNLGFDRENMIRVEPTARLFQKFEVFKNQLINHSSITHLAAANMNPLHAQGSNTGVSWAGKPKDARIAFRTLACSPEFPETFGLTLLEGEYFQSKKTDTLRTEVLVTEETAKIMGLNNPVGEFISIGDSQCVIIGVVNDFHTSSLHETRLPAILYRVDYMQTSAIYVRYQAGTTQQSLAALQAAYKQIEPDFTMKYWFQDDTFNELYKSEIIASKLILAFTVVALIIAVMGIIGLSTYNTLRKTKEIGVRKVLGASVFQVLRMLFNEFALILIIAILIAGPLAWYAAHQWLAGYAYRTAMPWWIFVATFTGIVVLIASIVSAQGIKTASMNPTKTLRSE
jgi:putative ABC transport system permease protein